MRRFRRGPTPVWYDVRPVFTGDVNVSWRNNGALAKPGYSHQWSFEMFPIIILLVAMAIVIGSVLLLRLHAFLSLLLGAMFVAILTSPQTLRDTELRTAAFQVRSLSENGEVYLKPPKGQSVLAGTATVFRMESDSSQLSRVGEISLTPAASDGQQKVSVNNNVDLRTGDLIVRDVQKAENQSKRNFATRISDGFGSTCAKIGILIALASIVGTCLLESGAADRIVSSIRNGLGEKNTPAAFTISGFIVGIPVFFDTVFYLLLPLAKAMRRKTGGNYLLYVLSVVIGATMAHSLVPPTPGPLFVANELNVDIGRMMLAGTVVGLLAATCGFVYALIANRWWTIDLPEESDSKVSDRRERKAPPLFLALLPIVLPVLLLGARTILSTMTTSPAIERVAVQLSVVDSTVAIGISACIGLFMLVAYAPTKRASREYIQVALQDAGSIILITSIGGAFGHVLRQSGIAFAIQHQFPMVQSGNALLCAAFGITAIVRVAQGSATVAMITSIGIIGPLAASVDLPFDPVYLALAIGCGSKPMPWMNDSGFWVVGRMSGMTERQTLSTFSVCLTIMGFAGFLVVLLGARVVPLLQ